MILEEAIQIIVSEEALVTSLPVVVSAPDQPDDFPVTVIAPRHGWLMVDWAELWKYRELLYYLTWRDILIRYKQTALGIAWAFLQPLATTIIFVAFLGRAGGFSQTIPNYMVYVLSGILPWTFLSNSVQLGGNSLLTNQNLVTKVYFPRLLVPLSCIGSCLFDLLISAIMLVGLLLWQGVLPSVNALFIIPFALLMLIILAAGVGSLLSALVVVQRDFRYILGFGVQMWMFATPTLYMDSSKFNETLATLIPLNPAFGLIQSIQYSIIGRPIEFYNLILSTVVSLLLFLAGIAFFTRVERKMVDVI